jgi:hypothetical protein
MSPISYSARVLSDGHLPLPEGLSMPPGQEVRVTIAPVEGNGEALKLVESWMRDPSDYDERVWPQLARDLEKHRLSERSRLGG